MAQTTSSDSSMQNQINPSSDQSKSVFDSLRGLATQSSSSFMNPSVGDTVPDDVELQPMPNAAADALPAAKDHHVAKTDDDTAIIAHPETRKVLGVISGSDTTASTGGDSDASTAGSDTDSDSNN
ncbi:hypothetical protein [Chelativorans sp. YIM 93263]|uniref:hypothetical protein n=1 Tax=Chelativorans sp. YIM 93263 TaxID=2906648 RepID=UPI0023787D04|nr:hypothetical protein [Chelativorans sp. YIM 93263]